MSIEALLKTSVHTLKDHGPKILTGLSVLGVVGTTVSAIHATSKVVQDVIEIEEREETKLSPKEIVQVAWKSYIPTATLATSTIVMIIGSNSMASKKTAAIASAYALSESTFREYKNKVVETLGDKAEKQVYSEISKDRYEKTPPQTSDIIITGNGTHLFNDSLSGRYFRSSMNAVDKAVNEVNFEINNHEHCSLNDFYDHLGLPRNVLGEDLGWRSDNKLEIVSSPMISDQGEPCIMIDYREIPKREYYRNF